MRRCALVLSLLAFAVVACSKSSVTVTKGPRPKGPAPMPAAGTAGAGGAANAANNSEAALGGRAAAGSPTAYTSQGPSQPSAALPAVLSEDNLLARYEALMTQATELLSEKKWPDALAAFEAARQLQDSELTKAAIERLKRKIDQETAAEQAVINIQSVLDEAKPDEAAKLAAEALSQFGHTDMADRVIKLKRQADALAALEGEDRSARFQRFRREYEAASKENNKRGALLALEQALQNGDDEALKQKYDELVAAVDRYDRLRDRAAELRASADQIDEAVAALQEAKQIWNNLTISQDLDELQVAQQNRRERLSVADFEVRGEVGVPDAGAFIADELLPAFKGQYELVERGRIGRAVEDLKLDAGLADDEDGRRQLGTAVKGLRYLVVGAITPIAGLTVQARLVDVQTGLVKQTATLVARTPEELTRRLPQLAQELMMSDEQKRALEQERAKQDAEVEVLKPVDLAELPPPPELIKDVPLPVIPARPKPPALGNIEPEQFVRRFDNLPPPPQPGQAIPLVVLAAERELELRRRSFGVALDLGDNLFRRGRIREAYSQFEFAFSLFPELPVVRLRVERCRALLPPAPIVVVRPRIAALDFVVLGAVPSYLRYWTPENLALYLAPELQVIDRSEMYWWMGRLGLTMYDLVNDPVARLYLGRALNVRYFLFGNLVQTASFDVTTYLVDAEMGYLASSARIHVANVNELKLRLRDLAWLTKLSPEQRRRVENDNAQWALLLNDIRVARDRRQDYERVLVLARKGLNLRPNSVEMLEIIREAERDRERMRHMQARTKETLRQQQELFELRERQRDLVLRAEAARLRADQQTAAERQRLQNQRRAAADDFVRQAQLMVQTKRFTVAVQLYESAASLRPNDDVVYRELAVARARAEEAARTALAEARARRETELRREREVELVRARAALEAERRQREADELAGRQAAAERDRRESERLLGLAQQLSAKQQYDQAVAAAQKAQRLRPTPEADRLVSQLLVELARANAEKRGAAAKAELERQLIAERERRLGAEAEAERNRKLYETLLAQGQQFLRQDKFSEAEEQLLRARKVHETDAVLTALRQAQAGKARAEARLVAERKKQDELKRQNELLKTKLADAKAALGAGRIEQAVNLYQEAKRIAPTNVEVLSGMAKAEQAREQELSTARRAGEEKSRREMFQRLLASGKASIEAKRYDAAALALGEAVRLEPNNKEAKTALAEAEAKMGEDAGVKERTKQKSEDYRAHLRDGRRFLAAKQFDQALSEFRSAKQINPTDRAVEEYIREAQNLKADADKTRAADVQAKRVAAQKSAELNSVLARVRAALAAGKLDEARTAYTSAAKIDANHPDVVRALGEIRKAQDTSVSAATDQKKKQDLAKLLDQARAAFQAKRFDDADKAISAALQLVPQDKDVQALQRQVAAAKKDAAAAALKRQEFVRQMAQGRAALQSKRFADAVRAFEAALEMVPKDTEATRLLAEAKKGTTATPPIQPKPAVKPPEYARQMQQGASLERSGRYDQALAVYRSALKALPNDADAQKKADFCQAMSDGARALQQRKFADAAKSYEVALKLFPNAAAAKAALQRAKTGK